MVSVEALAKAIHSRGLSTPAIFMLELSKPICGLLHPALLVSEPLIGALVGFQRYREQQAFWTKSENIEALIHQLENLMTHDRH